MPPALGRPSLLEGRTKRTKPYFALPANAYPCRRGKDAAKTSEGARGRSSCWAHMAHVPVGSDLVFPAAAAFVCEATSRPATGGTITLPIRIRKVAAGYSI
jgi:hypothetical protein